MVQPLFQSEESPTRDERLIQMFSQHCDSFPIIQCYKNKLLLNCGYTKEVEKIITEIESKLIESEQLPWWLELID